MQDDERAFLPPTAADLYRAAYRDGRVRLAGDRRSVGGRAVYRLEFDWLGSSYTLTFDADPARARSRAKRARRTGQ